MRRRILPCVVCQYPFSDRHHILPARLRPDSPLVALCPNCHRHANHLQELLEAGAIPEQVEIYLATFADAGFRDYAPVLIAQYHRLAARLAAG